MLSVNQGGIKYHFFFLVFGMTLLRIEPRFTGPLANTLLIRLVCIKRFSFQLGVNCRTDETLKSWLSHRIIIKKNFEFRPVRPRLKIYWVWRCISDYLLNLDIRRFYIFILGFVHFRVHIGSMKNDQYLFDVITPKSFQTRRGSTYMH